MKEANSVQPVDDGESTPIVCPTSPNVSFFANIVRSSSVPFIDDDEGDGSATPRPIVDSPKLPPAVGGGVSVYIVPSSNGNIDDPSSPLHQTITNNMHLMTISEALETAQEKRQRLMSHKVIYVTAFIMSIGFSIVLTSIWPYLKQLDTTASKVFYGLVIAINPLGQLVASPALGWWGSKMGSNRPAFLVSIVFFIVGNLMYALLRLMDRSIAPLCLMVSRFVVGVGSANIAVCRSYLSCSTMMEERSTALGYVAAAQSSGLILGPAIQTALAMAIPASSVGTRSVWDLYTAAGWIAAVLGLGNLLLFLPCVYKEVNISLREAEMRKQRMHNVNSTYPRPDYLAIFGLLSNFFFILFVYVLLETIIVPMTKDLYAWTSEFAIKVVGIGLSVIGVLAFIMFFVTTVLCKRMDERKVYIFCGIFPLILAMMTHIPMGHNYALMQDCSNVTDSSTLSTDQSFLTSIPTTFAPLLSSPNSLSFINEDEDKSPVKRDASEPESYIYPYFSALSRSKRGAVFDVEGDCDTVGCPASQEWCRTTPIIELPQLIVANLLGVIGYPVAFTISSSLFSKMLDPRNQGFWMGVLTSTGSLSRMMGPIFVTWVYSEYGTTYTFVSLSCALTGTFVVALLLYKRLVPMDMNKNNPNAQDNETTAANSP